MLVVLMSKSNKFQENKFETRKHSNRMRTARLLTRRGVPSWHPLHGTPFIESPSWSLPFAESPSQHPLHRTILHGTLFHGTPIGCHLPGKQPSRKAPPLGQTNTSGNITFPQLRLRAVKIETRYKGGVNFLPVYLTSL